RLGNLKFAHYGAVSHMKEICPKHGIRLEERMFAKGLDIVPGILAGEIDLAASALDGAIAGRASGAPVLVVAGFAKGGARILARKDGGVTRLADLKGKKVGTARGGAPVRALVMTEKLYGNRDVALRTMRCFVEATKEFIDKPDEAEKYVREKMFRGALTADEYKDAMGNAAFTYDITPEQVQITADLMTKYGVGKMSRTPKAEEFVKLDLLQEAKRAAGVK